MGQYPASCCGSKCGQPTIVSIGDDVCPPRHAGPDGDPGLGAADALPEWLSELAPSLMGEQAERAADAWVQCGEELRRRTRQFARRATCGVPCWFIDQRGGRTQPASYILDEALESFFVETVGPSEVHPWEPNGPSAADYRDGPTRHVASECQIAEIRNIWICADAELARRVHGTLRHGCDADLACVMLIDGPSGPIGLVERSTEAREEFLDCMAVLISAQRLRNEPDVACCRRVEGPPPPEARLRPFGQSLQSAHISGPICVWLAQAAEDLLNTQVDPTATSARSGEGSAIESSVPTSDTKAQVATAAMPGSSSSSKAEQILVELDPPLAEGSWAEDVRAPAASSTPSFVSVRGGAANGANRTPAPNDVKASKARSASVPPQSRAVTRVEHGVVAPGRSTALAPPELENISTKTVPADMSTDRGRPRASNNGNMGGLPPRDAPGRPPPASFDQMPMMMGSWVADQPQPSAPTIMAGA